MTAAQTLAIVVPICVLVTVVLVAVIVSRAHKETLSTLNSMHNRSSALLDKSLDRLMSIRWEDFVAMQSYESDDIGGFISPEEQKEEEGQEGEVVIVEPGQWGALSQLQALSEAQENEQRLLAEDFPPERTAS
jgi:hypothetical protein